MADINVGVYSITPVPAPRITARDRRGTSQCPRVQRYFAFKDKVRELNIQVYEKTKIIFFMPMPSSWSEKEKSEHYLEPHKKTPKIDNLIKGLLDATLKSDSHIWQIEAKKIWSDSGFITVEELE